MTKRSEREHAALIVERKEVLNLMSDTWRESVESGHKTLADYVTMLKGDTNPELEGKNNG